MCHLFGQPVENGVLALTKDKNLTKELRIKDSLERIKQQPKEVWMVKIADRITNLQEPPKEWPLAKRKKYLEEAIVIYEELKDSSIFLAVRLMNEIETYHFFLD